MNKLKHLYFDLAILSYLTISNQTLTMKKDTLASCSYDETIKIWDLSKSDGKECIKTLTGNKDLVWSIAFIPDNGTKEEKTFKEKLLDNLKSSTNKKEKNGITMPELSDVNIKFN